MFKEHHQNYIIEPTRVPQRKNIFKSALKKGNSLERVRSIDRDLGQNESAKFWQNKKRTIIYLQRTVMNCNEPKRDQKRPTQTPTNRPANDVAYVVMFTQKK